MPLVRIDAPAGLDDGRLRGLSDAVHAALVATAGVPLTDRFHLFQRHAPGTTVIDPGFPDVRRSHETTIISIVLRRGRSDDQKRALYRAIAEGAAQRAGLAADDVFVVLIENGPSDWSFGGGTAFYAPAS